MATMKSVKHEMLKQKWRQHIRECQQSGLTVKRWCLENEVRESQYYYWLKTIREESLVQAGSLAMTGTTQFAEVMLKQESVHPVSQETCAVLRIAGFEVEVLNGANTETLANILRILKSSC
jgi:transposase-like protein